MTPSSILANQRHRHRHASLLTLSALLTGLLVTVHIGFMTWKIFDRPSPSAGTSTGATVALAFGIAAVGLAVLAFTIYRVRVPMFRGPFREAGGNEMRALAWHRELAGILTRARNERSNPAAGEASSAGKPPNREIVDVEMGTARKNAPSSTDTSTRSGELEQTWGEAFMAGFMFSAFAKEKPWDSMAAVAQRQKWWSGWYIGRISWQMRRPG